MFGTSVLLSLGVAVLPAIVAHEDCRAPHPFSGKDQELQAELEARIARQDNLQDAVASGRLKVAVVDLSDPYRMVYAGLNDDDMLYAASLPKIAILLAVIDAVNRGDLQWTDDFAHRLQKMITISNNHFASWAFDLLGAEAIGKIMQAHDYCLYSQPHGGLWLGRGYSKSRSNIRDPLFRTTHGATAKQTARFYALLDAGRLVSPYWSQRMLALMAPPEYVHKFVAALAGQPGVRFLARKSGTWQQFHADSALIQHWHHRYVLVGLAEDWQGEMWLRSLAVIVDELIRSRPVRSGMSSRERLTTNQR